MSDTSDLRKRLEGLRSYHLKEVERISKLLEAIKEAESYLAKDTTHDDAQSRLVLTPPVEKGGKSNPVRIRRALLRMPQTFTSNDLWEVANGDGGPQIDKRKVFAPFFTSLKKGGEAREIQPPHGKAPGIYEKGDSNRTIELLKKGGESMEDIKNEG